jgi:hypothetical protein
MKLMKIRPFLFAIAAMPMWAQPPEVFQARVTNTASDRGKCTIEVVVDGIAEIEIRGLQGRIRTLGGSPTTWRRMDCNQALPANPIDFQFRGQEGRGRQYLLREPSQNRGAALIRIEDSDGGREGYKFDLEWRGSEGGFGKGGGFPGGGFSDDGFGRGDSPGWDRAIDFRSRGDGYIRGYRGRDEVLRDAQLSVDRRGRVRVEFQTNGRDRIQLNGRVLREERRRLIADVSGNGLQGTMEILIDNRDRVQEIAMSGVGRNRFELRWQSQR